MQGHRTAAAPAPHADSGRVYPGPAPHGAERCRMIADVEYSNLLVDGFAKRAAAGSRRTAIIDRGDHVSLLGQHQIPEVPFALPDIEDGLRRRLAVDLEEDRVPPGGVEAWRFHHPGIQLQSRPGGYLHELRSAPAQLGYSISQPPIVHQGPDHFVLGKGDQVGDGGSAEGREVVDCPPAIAGDEISVVAGLVPGSQSLRSALSVDTASKEIQLGGVLGRCSVVDPTTG